MPVSKRTQSGFGMLEVLVALVLIATVGGAIIVWVQGGLDSVIRMRAVNAELQSRRLVGEWSHALNPMLTPKGEAEVGDLHVEWEAAAAAEVTPQAGYPRGIGSYDVALYRVRLRVFTPKEKRFWFEENVLRVGSRRARDPMPSLF